MTWDSLGASLRRLYWSMRIGIAFLWIWTAIASWFFSPHAISLDWLQQLGLVQGRETIFVLACVLDAGMGVATLCFPGRRLWQLQCIVVLVYSAAITIRLPEFLFHPFGPLTKNLMVLACLYFLITMETIRQSPPPASPPAAS